MPCPECGSQVPEGSRFCNACGAGIADRSGDPAQTRSGQGTVAAGPLEPESGLRPGERFADRYEILREIGRDACGTAYVATDEWEGAKVRLDLIRASLLLQPGSAERFLATGTAARRLTHRSIANVFDVSCASGTYYFTSALRDGKTLRTWLDEGIAAGIEISLPAAVGIAGEILAGLSEAHRAGLAHGALSPEQVTLLGEPGKGDHRLEIRGFGLALSFAGDPRSPETADLFAPPAYRAPEATAGAARPFVDADLYATAVMFYEMLMEVPPVGRWDLPSEARPEIPPRIDEILKQALNRHPGRRFSSADELAGALEAVVAGRPANAYPYSPEEQRRFTSLLAGPGWAEPAAPFSEQGMLLAVHERTGLEFVMIPGGEFDMGGSDSRAEDFEKPVHRVAIAPFLLATTLCTQRAWDLLHGRRGIRVSSAPDLPTDDGDWDDIRAWCDRAGGGVRLPTEAEWEYAARAGTTAAFSFGDAEENLPDHAWYFRNSGDRLLPPGTPWDMEKAYEEWGCEPHPVRGKQPNPWGLYDVHGNLHEYCEDDFHNTHEGAPTDGSARTKAAGSAFVLRGGACASDGAHCRSSARIPSTWDLADLHTGFRPAATLPQAPGHLAPGPIPPRRDP